MRKRGLVAGFLTGTLMLAGCTDRLSTSGGSSRGTLATLIVHIGLFGGPARPGGGMALSDSPAENENVTAVNAAGDKSVARTNADGVATLTLTPGKYTVFSTYCGTGPRHVVLATGQIVRVQIDCPAP